MTGITGITGQGYGYGVKVTGYLQYSFPQFPYWNGARVTGTPYFVIGAGLTCRGLPLTLLLVRRGEVEVYELPGANSAVAHY